MNKNLLILALSILTLVACRGRSEHRTEYVEENIEYHPLVTDSAAIDLSQYRLLMQRRPLETLHPEYRAEAGRMPGPRCPTERSRGT